MAAGLAEMEDVHASQDALLCSMFAHAEELALGPNVMQVLIIRHQQ